MDNVGACQRLFFTLVVALLMASPLLAVDERLTLQDLKLENGAGVVFHPFDESRVLEIEAGRLRQMQVANTSTGGYSLYIDVDSIYSNCVDGFVNYVFYLRKHGATPAGLLKFNFQATPYGSFLDRRADITARLRAGNSIDESIPLTLPVHSCSGPGSVAIHGDPDLHVHVSGDTVSFTITNQLSDLDVDVTSIELLPIHADKWRKPPVPDIAISVEAPLQLGPRESKTVHWVIDPNEWRAISSSFLPSSKTADETVNFTVTSASALGGVRFPVELPEDVHFYPTAPALITAVLLGVIAATAAMFWGVNNQVGFRKFLRNVGINFLIVSIVEVSGIFLWSNTDTTFHLVGVNLNPVLLLPGAFVGIVTGILGPNILDIIFHTTLTK